MGWAGMAGRRQAAGRQAGRLLPSASAAARVEVVGGEPRRGRLPSWTQGEQAGLTRRGPSQLRTWVMGRLAA